MRSRDNQEVAEFTISADVKYHSISEKFRVSNHQLLRGFEKSVIVSPYIDLAERSGKELLRSGLEFQRPGPPAFYGLWGNKIIFFPIPDRDYSVVSFFYKGIIIEGEDIPLASNFHYPAIVLAESFGWRRLAQTDKAQGAFNQHIQLLASQRAYLQDTRRGVETKVKIGK